MLEFFNHTGIGKRSKYRNGDRMRGKERESATSVAK
jgi:hypothetical protein